MMSHRSGKMASIDQRLAELTVEAAARLAELSGIEDASALGRLLSVNLIVARMLGCIEASTVLQQPPSAQAMTAVDLVVSQLEDMRHGWPSRPGPPGRHRVTE
jgi:hypothetical protein